jgi:hypothetical protein
MELANYILGYHLVAFLDVLGQREKFRQLRLPKTPEEYLTVQEVLRDTAGFVSNLRAVFRTEFEALEAGRVNSQPGAEKVFHPNFLGFSDSFIASVPLMNSDEHLTPNTRIFSTLSAACIVLLTSLSSKHALRGGIEVGLATELSQGEIYGSALERAYLLESIEADYPRVLIGDGLWRYLSLGLCETEKLDTPAALNLGKLIRREMELTTLDADGRRILDYLGPGIASTSTRTQANTLVKPAYQFVLDQQEHWLSKGNTRLSGRYAILRQYFESRLALWGLRARRPSMPKETLEHLNNVEKVIGEAKRLLSRHVYPDSLRTVILAGCVDQMIEHHEAMLCLMRNAKFGSAFALARSIVEGMYRGLWLNFCATDAQVEQFERKDELPLSMAELADAIDEKYSAEGFFADLKKRTWPALNSYTHTGMLQLGRRFTGHKAEPSYKDGEISAVTTTVTTCILLLVSKFLAVQNQPEDSREIEALLGTYGSAARQNPQSSA